MTFHLRDHTADVAVEATNEDLGGVFADVASGLTAAMCDEWPETGERFEIEERAENREALLFDYLDRLIYERDVRGVLPVDHECSVVELESGDEQGSDHVAQGKDTEAADTVWVARASARGVPFEAVQARDIKAVTYSEMTLERQGDEWYAYVVFDV